IARKSVLGEVSFVALGADDATSALIAATKHKEQPVMDTTTTPGTTPPSTLTPPAAAPATPITAAAPAAITATASTPAEQLRAETAAEANRIVAVRKACGGKHMELEAKAIADGWDA